MTTPHKAIENGYSTGDLGQAAFLVALGYEVLRFERLLGSRRCIFYFPVEAGPEADKYYRNAQVPARTFNNALRDLKARVRES